MKRRDMTNDAPRRSWCADDRVVWAYRPGGGYGFVIPVAGVVLSVSGGRATIRVARKVAGRWLQESRTVSTSKLYPRQFPAPEVDVPAEGAAAAQERAQAGDPGAVKG